LQGDGRLTSAHVADEISSRPIRSSGASWLDSHPLEVCPLLFPATGVDLEHRHDRWGDSQVMSIRSF
jgi:hypothetical protein